MNNIEKKLDALIDALGFDVEEITVRQGMPPAGRRLINEEAAPTASKISIEYKLTKRVTPQYTIHPDDIDSSLDPSKPIGVVRCKEHKYKQTMFGLDLNFALIDKGTARQLIAELAIVHDIKGIINE